jgi:hypothetical protein
LIVVQQASPDQLRWVLMESKARHVAEAGDIADALKLAETVDFGIALLDSDLRGIDPVAAIINERRLPSSLPAVMARLACRKNFATDRCCKSHF